MKKLVFTSLLFIMGALFTQNAKAQTATASATATIISPIAITKTTDLAFGNIVAGSSIGTVIVSTTNARTKTGGVTLPTATPGTFNAAAFNVTGLANATYTIATNVVTPPTSGSNTMALTLASDPTGTGTIGSSGSQIINVGGTLSVAANQPAGSYTGSFTVTVAYN